MLDTLSRVYDRHMKTPYLYQVFTVFGNIGEGCFGSVYRAQSKEDDNFYAIKIAKRSKLVEWKKYREVQHLEKIGCHPHCVRYFGAWEEKDRVFIQFELCATSLDKYAKANHKIPENQLWDILIDISLVS